MNQDGIWKLCTYRKKKEAVFGHRHLLASQKLWQRNGGNTMNTPYQDQNNDLINRRFDEQNKILEEQNVILARLLELLGGKE